MRGPLSRALGGPILAHDLHPVIKMAELYNITLYEERYAQARALHNRYTDEWHEAVIEERDAACRDILRAYSQAEANAAEQAAITAIEIELPRLYPRCRDRAED